MTKLRLHGGIKLIDVQAKSETYKIMWLMQLITDPNLMIHRAVMTKLIGKQKGGLEGHELYFTYNQYSRLILKIPHSTFYKEAIQSITKLNVQKRIERLECEKVFYNPIFRDNNFKTIPITPICERNKIYTYGDISTEYVKQHFGQPHSKHVANIHRRITITNLRGKSENTLYLTESMKRIPFHLVTHKQIYNEIIQLGYKEHHSKKKWEEKFHSTHIVWPTVWESLNNPVATEDTKSLIWEQLHLNDYQTYSYNKWHNTQQNCPLCLQLPQTKFHLTLQCKMTTILWKDLEYHLRMIHPVPVSDEEKVFGLHGHKPGIILRNWLTFLLRRCISEYEHIAYYNKKGLKNENDIKHLYNQTVYLEVWEKYNVLSNLKRDEYFKRIFAVNDHLIEWNNGRWNIITDLLDVTHPPT